MKAFPLSNMTGLNQQGMDLRDYFAAKAMEGLIAANPAHDMDDAKVGDAIANAAYFVANAMIKARETK